MIQDLTGRLGLSLEAARFQADQLAFFVYGAAGPTGSGSYGLLRYDNGDEVREAASSAEQIAHAEAVNTALGTCGG
jgi:hypothetical protein